MKTCVIYLRYANFCDEPTVNCHKEILTNLMSDKGFNIKAYFIDNGYSGLNFNRPDFQNMMTYIEVNNINAIAVMDFTKISRNMLDFAAFVNKMQEQGIELYSRDGFIKEDFSKITGLIEEYHKNKNQ